jgi:hypothetical protein
MTTLKTIAPAAFVLLAGLARAQDANPAPFPDKAQAILVQGSTEGRFQNDINNMETTFTSVNNRWVYGASNLQKMLFGGTGAGLSSWANVQTAFQNAGNNMWSKPAREQNLVYVHSSHGLGGNDGTANDARGSQMEFGPGAGGGMRSAIDFRNLIAGNLPQGHNQYSLNGATPTTCVRTMNYLLEPCHSGGQIFELTETLGSKDYRRKYFPALSDITVMTAADNNECSYGLPDGSGNRFMRELYGYESGGSHVSGSLEGAGARNSWSVYQTAAQRNIANDGNAYTPGSLFGTGNNATQFVRSTASDGRGSPEHNLYRHVQFYPSVTFGEAGDGRVNVGSGNVNLDFRLNAANAPVSGAIPMTLSLTGCSGGEILADRDRLPTTATPLPDPSLSFVQFYTFNLINSGGVGFSGGSMRLTMETDDAVQASTLGALRLFRYDGSGWQNTGAPFDWGTSSFDVGGLSSLGTYAVVVPEPGVLALGCLGALLLMRRRR